MVFNWFKSSKEESTSTQQPSWDANTMTMQQPSSPEAPSTERVVTQQPNTQEEMKMGLRGGGAGDVCCGVYVYPFLPFFPLFHLYSHHDSGANCDHRLVALVFSASSAARSAAKQTPSSHTYVRLLSPYLDEQKIKKKKRIRKRTCAAHL
ncbi:uncharacterized protein BO88DRAFT_85913 [Aspergillus vadensis CBS 113365]|uniref:Uncharacterized protein n=1 Tax=Aspergillus vadensis (strain CBS 113365 / IMI 142717 / IBT 24658) TaxID=1448311 RepID=A0A319BM53_ASPVC|nr:hypothetical protein BO88DRAFT_85913 [Aspergillus vadensis CBS 113365]PYH66743.1 hypothetical protein BO88DRAFT_85913 [Aspergillus vadensis CBS 113365]